jgi:mono/diheme cytochrome c family protein
MRSTRQWVLSLLVMTVSLAGAMLVIEKTVATPFDGPVQARDKQRAGSVSEVMKGEGLYNASCIVCHGSRGTGGIGPRLAGNPVLMNEPAFWKAVSEGRHVMPPMKGVVTLRQMVDIQAWLKTLP